MGGAFAPGIFEFLATTNCMELERLLAEQALLADGVLGKFNAGSENVEAANDAGEQH